MPVCQRDASSPRGADLHRPCTLAATPSRFALAPRRQNHRARSIQHACQTGGVKLRYLAPGSRAPATLLVPVRLSLCALPVASAQIDAG